ncbi:hypothetical protein ACFLXU_01365 [Chloroflexota bacterium]
MNVRQFWSLCCFLLIVCIVVVGFGCSPYNIRPSNEGYKELSIMRGLVQFSFDYPSTWDLSPIEIQKDLTIITMFGESTSWSFFVKPVSIHYTSAEVALKDEISRYRVWLGFNLIERSDIEIGGVLAKQAIYSYRSPQAPTFMGGTGGPPVPVTIRAIYFTRNGLLWSIRISSDSDIFESEDVHFEHLLRTFKILD